MAEKEYNKAIASFELVLEDKPNDKEMLESKNMMKNI